MTGDWQDRQESQDSQDRQDSPNQQTDPDGRAILGIENKTFRDSGAHLGTILHNFGTILAPWTTILASLGYPGAPNWPQGGPRWDFYRFWVDLGSQSDPHLVTFGTVFA